VWRLALLQLRGSAGEPVNDAPLPLEITYSSLTMSATIAKIIPAFIAAKKDMGPLKKGANNPFFKSKYADLGSVIDVSEDALLENGIATLQSPGGDGNNISVTTLFAHVSGEWIQGHLVLAPVKNDPQAAGSAITYARRYALQAMCNLAAEDDDGTAATKPRSVPQEAPKPAPAPKDPQKMQQRTQGRLFALLSERGLMETRREWAIEQGIPASSFSALTDEDAKFLIKRLEAMPPLPDPDEALLAYAEGRLV
jgi:hypothetical protein